MAQGQFKNLFNQLLKWMCPWAGLYLRDQVLLFSLIAGTELAGVEEGSSDALGRLEVELGGAGVALQREDEGHHLQQPQQPAWKGFHQVGWLADKIVPRLFEAVDVTLKNYLSF